MYTLLIDKYKTHFQEFDYIVLDGTQNEIHIQHIHIMLNVAQTNAMHV